MSKNLKLTKIVISGWYGHGNIGDEAILSAIFNSIQKEIPRVSITTLSYNPTYSSKIHTIKAAPQFPFGILSICASLISGRMLKTLKILWKTDIFILGGGGFLSDWQSWTVILKWLGQIWLAKTFNKKTMLYAIGAGPITTKIGKLLVRHIINRKVDAITVRDSRSRKWLIESGVKVNIMVSADPVVNITSPKINHKAKKKILVCLAPIFNSKSWPNMTNKFNKFNKSVEELIKYLNNKKNTDLAIISFYKNLDYNYCKYYSQKYNIKLIDSNKYSLKHLIIIIKKYTHLYGVRLHSLILGMSCGLHVSGISYHFKNLEFLKSINSDKFSVIAGDGINIDKKDIDNKDMIKRAGLLLSSQEQTENIYKNIRDKERKNVQCLNNLINS